MHLAGDPTVSFSQQRVQSRKCQEGLRTMTKAFQKAALVCSLATFLAAGFAQEKQQAPEGASLPADDPFPAFPPTPARKAPNSSPDLPKLVVGERWFYRLSPHRMNACNPSGASTFSVVVQSVGDDGVTLKRGSREIRLNSSLGELQEVNSTRNVQDTFNFPIVPGKKWEQRMLVNSQINGPLRTDLTCEHGPLEKVSVPAGEFEAYRFVCKGQWTNLTFGNSDSATYTYWYSPEVKNFVKIEVLTWFRGSYCADHETVLLKFTQP